LISIFSGAFVASFQCNGILNSKGIHSTINVILTSNHRHKHGFGTHFNSNKNNEESEVSLLDETDDDESITSSSDLFDEVDMDQPTELMVMKEVRSYWCPTDKNDASWLGITNVCYSYLGYTNFVMKLLGINLFTYILAAAIAFFLSMNLILGPGWLGNSIGIDRTGTFQEVSDSLPDTLDLSKNDFLI
jgi:hypothetical protein